jgi:hypothetical protein
MSSPALERPACVVPFRTENLCTLCPQNTSRSSSPHPLLFTCYRSSRPERPASLVPPRAARPVVPFCSVNLCTYFAHKTQVGVQVPKYFTFYLLQVSSRPERPARVVLFRSVNLCTYFAHKTQVGFQVPHALLFSKHATGVVPPQSGPPLLSLPERPARVVPLRSVNLCRCPQNVGVQVHILYFLPATGFVPPQSGPPALARSAR